MAESTIEPAKRPLTVRSRITNGQQLLDGIDGRSAFARRYRDILGQLVSDLGGDPSEAQNLIARRAASIACWCEREEINLAGDDGNKGFKIGEYTTAANTLRRLLSDLGLERRMRDITPNIDAYLNGNAVS